MAKHEHGSMDTEVQEKTFEGFISWVTKNSNFLCGCTGVYRARQWVSRTRSFET